MQTHADGNEIEVADTIATFTSIHRVAGWEFWSAKFGSFVTTTFQEQTSVPTRGGSC